MREAVLYARVSSLEQEKEGFSQGDQIGEMRAYAKRLDLKVVQEFIVQESAKDQGRSAFGEAVAILKKKNGPKIFLVTQVDRLTRNFTDAVVSEELIKKHGVTIHLVKEGMVLHKDSNSAQMAFFYQMVVMAKHYIDRLSENTRNGMRQKAREGGWYASAPYGYRMEKKHLVPDPEQAGFVQKAFALYSTGMYSLKATIEALKESGLNFRPYQPRIPKGNLERMLKRRIYIGEIEMDGTTYPGKHEPIISLDTWNDVQKALKKDGKPIQSQKHDFTYRGLLNCEECGAALTGEFKKGGKYTYYRCTSFKDGCSQGYINESKIDEAVYSTLAELELGQEYKDMVLEAVRALDSAHDNSYEHEINRYQFQLTRARNNRKKAYHDRLNGVIDEEMWLEISRECQEQIDITEAKIQNLNNADASFYDIAKQYIELPERLNRSWKAATPDEKKVLLNLFISNFYVKDGNVSPELKEPFCYLSKMAKNKNWGPCWDDLPTFLAENAKAIKRIYQALAA